MLCAELKFFFKVLRIDSHCFSILGSMTPPVSERQYHPCVSFESLRARSTARHRQGRYAPFSKCFTTVAWIAKLSFWGFRHNSPIAQAVSALFEIALTDRAVFLKFFAAFFIVKAQGV